MLNTEKSYQSKKKVQVQLQKIILNPAFLKDYINHCAKQLAIDASVAHLALSEGECDIFGKRHSNKMIKFLLIEHFHHTKNYQSIIVYGIYIVYVPQYPIQGGI